MTTMLKRGTLNNVKRFANPMLIYKRRIEECEQEAVITAKELQQVEHEFSRITPRREEELEWINTLIDFLGSKVMAST